MKIPADAVNRIAYRLAYTWWSAWYEQHQGSPAAADRVRVRAFETMHTWKDEAQRLAARARAEASNV